MRWLMLLSFVWALSPAVSFSQGTTSPLPPAVRLDGLAMVYQDINRCSAAALTMQLSFWVEEPVSYRGVIQRLNPHPGDVSVRIEEMALAAEEMYGLKGIVRRGGTIDLLKRLVAAGFPVLVENSYYDGADLRRDWMSHNRVLMGYDDALRELYFFDSLLGNGQDGRGRPMSYAEFDERWLPFNRDYLVLYRPEQEPVVQEILGAMWDPVANAEWVIEQAQADHDNLLDRTLKAESLMNVAWGYVQLGDTALAARIFDEARAMNALPWRYFWYEFTIMEAYLAEGRYQDMLDLAIETLAASGNGVEEMYYYAGLAAAGLGDMVRARGNYEAAIQRNAYFTEAIEALAAMQ
jgi:tetratricopeptide (TPR) repeat protein